MRAQGSEYLLVLLRILGLDWEDWEIVLMLIISLVQCSRMDECSVKNDKHLDSLIR